MNEIAHHLLTRTERRRTSVDMIRCEAKKESCVLVIYSGGTIGMLSNSEGALAPAANSLGRHIRRSPFLHDEEYARKRFGEAAANAGKTPFVLPEAKKKRRRVLYTLLEYDPLLDSSNMTLDEWICIAEDIKKWYESFDGFVILHGTDTLAYSASALSFMLENLGKTVVLTGAQLSIFEPRSDAKDNFLESLIIAGNYVIPEVTVCFGRKLYRGNRTTKMDAEGFNAFDSPCYSPLATFGIEIEVKNQELFRPSSMCKFKLHSKLNPNVGLLRLFPSITAQTVHAFLQPPIQGVVLQTYGSGNMPCNRQDLLDEIKAAVGRGVIMLNCLQCIRGTVKSTYETGKVLADIGVTSGADMTPEAALTKLSYVLSKEEWDIETKQKMLRLNLRGELTLATPSSPMTCASRMLTLSAENGMELDPFSVSSVLFPALLCFAALTGDSQRIDTLISHGADLSQPNADQRTALHLACCEGKLDMVEYMLHRGASVHTKDRHGHTPLDDAVLNDHHQIIKLLIQCGAHLTTCSKLLGEKLCKAASHGDTVRLESYKLAGAKLSESDYSGRTALHMAALHDHLDCVSFLIEQGFTRDTSDILGFTPKDYALKVNNEKMVSLLEDFGTI